MLKLANARYSEIGSNQRVIIEKEEKEEFVCSFPDNYKHMEPFIVRDIYLPEDSPLRRVRVKKEIK